MEWALYPGNSSCTDYFCFINRLRDDIGVSALTLVGTGSLGAMSMRPMHEPMLSNAGYAVGVPSTRYQPASFEDFDDDQFLQLLQHQAMHFVVNVIPYGNYTPQCASAERRFAEWPATLLTCWLDSWHRAHFFPESLYSWQRGLTLCAITE